MKKIKSHDWDDDGNQLSGIETKDFYYDVSESGLKNSLFLGKNAHELSPSESLALGKWLVINSIRGLAANAAIEKDSETLNMIGDYSSKFVKDLTEANLDFNGVRITAKKYKDAADLKATKTNVRRLAMIASCSDGKVRDELLNDPELYLWLKNVLEA